MLSCAAFGIMSLSNELTMAQLTIKISHRHCSDLAPPSTNYYEEAGTDKNVHTKECVHVHGFLGCQGHIALR